MCEKCQDNERQERGLLVDFGYFVLRSDDTTRVPGRGARCDNVLFCDVIVQTWRISMFGEMMNAK